MDINIFKIFSTFTFGPQEGVIKCLVCFFSKSDEFSIFTYCRVDFFFFTDSYLHCFDFCLSTNFPLQFSSLWSIHIEFCNRLRFLVYVFRKYSFNLILISRLFNDLNFISFTFVIIGHYIKFGIFSNFF